MSKSYDFSGWATRYNVECSDGRTIRPGAFEECDGITVPLMWNHNHDDPSRVMGHAFLKHFDKGVKAYCTFNNTEAGKLGKEMIRNGDVQSLSIYANRLKQKASDVIHGAIREVSIVLAGANPEAFIDTVMVHSDDDSEEAIIYTGIGPFGYIEDPDESIEHADKKEEEEVADEKKKPEDETSKDKEAKIKGKSMKEIYETMNDEQKKLMDIVVGAAIEDAKKDDSDEDDNDDSDKEEKKMKHNLFEADEVQGNFLMHSDEKAILKSAREIGSFRQAFNNYVEDNDIIMHGDAPTWGPVPVGGFDQDTSKDGSIGWLFPDYKDVNPNRPPEMITDDWTWQEKVIAKCHKLPFSRVRTNYVDIRKIDELRAKGYPRKGAYKSYSGNFTMARRTTDPQTVYIKNALHRDDIVDITDFDYVKYLYDIDMQMLKNEIATAILFGDGRSEESEDKIFPDKIRPIWTDDDLYTMKAILDLDEVRSRLNGTETSKYFGDNYVLAEAFVEKLLYTREKFKGSGSPDMYINPHMVNVMLLSRDRDGHRMYRNIDEIKTALNVNSIVTIEQMENLTRFNASTGKTYKLDALLVNLQDYAIGSTKGGEISHFTQFDIDFNQEKSLIETRLSGALTKLWSAIAIEEEVTTSGGNNNSSDPETTPLG